MKVYYFNDRAASVLMRVQMSFVGLVEEILEAHKGKEYDVFIPKGHVFFVKEWGYNMVELSSKEKERK